MRLSIIGASSPELALRVLNLLAQQDVVLDRAVIERCGDECRITIRTAPLSSALGERIIAKIRAMVLVRSVEAHCE